MFAPFFFFLLTSLQTKRPKKPIKITLILILFLSKNLKPTFFNFLRFSAHKKNTLQQRHENRNMVSIT